MLQIQDLSVSYLGGNQVLKGVNLTVGAGEVVALVGESGCGKSTLARAVVGILPQGAVMRGEIRLGGESWSPSWRGRKVGLILQDPMTRFNPFMTVFAHAQELLTVHGISRAAVPSLLAEALTQVHIDRRHAYSYAHELSGGMRQRVMIALTLLLQPQVLIADEPTTSLDAQTARSVLQLMVDICRRQSKGLLLISHDLGLVRRYCDRVAVMAAGKLVAVDSPDRLFQGGERPYARQSLVRGGQPVLEARALSKKYGQFVAVDNVSFVLYPQEVLGIIGASGSGKSTTARMVANLIKPDRGKVLIHNQTPRGQKLARHLQMIFQDPRASLNPKMTIAQAVADPLLIHNRRGDHHRLVGELLERVGLSAQFMHRYPQELSGGQLQRVAIARALILQPEILICDEPVSMLDAHWQGQILQLLADLQKQYQLSLLFITHDLNLARHFCDRLLVMYRGQIVETGTAEEIMQNPHHPYTQALVAQI
ncbi:MAG: ABC transporter ATP-binding protein [Pseudanabaenaceae cyanobacterium]